MRIEQYGKLSGKTSSPYLSFASTHHFLAITDSTVEQSFDVSVSLHLVRLLISPD